MLKTRYLIAAVFSPVFMTSVSALAQTGFANFEFPHVSPLALTPSGLTLLAVNTPDARLELFDTTGPVPVWSSSISVGLEPVSVRARSESEVWVINHLSDSISIIDLPSRRVTRTLLTGDEPTDVVFAGVPTPTRAFVTLSQRNQIAVYDLANLAAAPTLLAINGEDPRALAVSPDGSRVYAAIFESANTTTCIPKEAVANTNGPYSGQVPPRNSGNTFSPPRNPLLPSAPLVAQIVRRNAAGQWMDDNARNWSQFVTWNVADRDVAIINTQSLAITYAGGMLTNVMGLAVRPDGTITPIGTESTNEVRFEPNIKSTFIRVRIGSFNAATPGTTQVADLNPHLSYTVRSIPQTQRNLSIGDPRAIVWHAATNRAYISGMGSNNIILSDTTGARHATINVGEGPTGLALSPDQSRLFVLNKFDSSISTISTSTNTETSRTPFFDPTPLSIKLGRPLLYDTHDTSGLGQASCASCHIDGRTDFLAWDLGDPSGTMKVFNQSCSTPSCGDWHPMKGPMVTQTLQGIVGTEPLHWRGDREDLAAFAPAFVGLQGDDAEPSAAEMQIFTDFIATILYPPNPNRGLDNSLPTSLPVTTGTGNAFAGFGNYTNLPSLNSASCSDCHGPAEGTGTSGKIDQASIALFPQPTKIAQLRGLHERTGWNKSSQTANRGFGFNHNSEFDTIWSLLGVGFTFTNNSAGTQQKRDLEAYILCFNTGTHAGVGQQVMFTGPDNSTPALTSRLNTFITLANSGAVGLVARDRDPSTGRERGWVYTGSNTFTGNRAGLTATPTALRTAAAPGNEVAFTLTRIGTQRRIGIDRDADTWPDADELSVCANPADPTSFPGGPGCVDVNADLTITIQDLFDYLTAYFNGNAEGDFNRSGAITVQDLFDYISAFFNGC